MKSRWIVASLFVSAGCSWIVDLSDIPHGPADDGGVAGDDGGVRLDANDTDASNDRDAGAPHDGGANVDDAPTDASSAADVRASLIGEWLFDRDDGGPLAPDTSGHGHDGELFGAGVVHDGGIRGGALFTNDGGGIKVTALDFVAFPASGTLALWVRPEGLASDTELRGLFDAWDGSRNHVFVRRTGAPCLLQIALQENDGGYAWDRNHSLALGTWAHLALTWDAVAHVAVLYVGGVEVGRKTNTGDFEPNQQLVRIGGMFNGVIDEARLFDRPLSASEVGSLL